MNAHQNALRQLCTAIYGRFSPKAILGPALTPG